MMLRPLFTEAYASKVKDTRFDGILLDDMQMSELKVVVVALIDDIRRLKELHSADMMVRHYDPRTR